MPPPPATAFTITGKPIARADASTSASLAPLGSGDAVPGTTSTPAASAAVRADVLLPMSRMASAEGPTKTRPASPHAAANSAFSARKP